jgi:hypothetical protein
MNFMNLDKEFMMEDDLDDLERPKTLYRVFFYVYISSDCRERYEESIGIYLEHPNDAAIEVRKQLGLQDYEYLQIQDVEEWQ